VPALKLEQFGGQLPAWSEHLLPIGQAAASENTYLFSGALEGWREPSLLRELTNPNAKYAYRIPTLSETQATAYLVAISNPQAGDQIMVSELTYTFVSALTSSGVANQVLIAATPIQTLTNLLNALTYDFGLGTNVGISYGIGTLANSDVLSYPPNVPPQSGLPGPQVGYVAIGETIYPYLQIGSTDFGAAFNTVGVSASPLGVRLTWLKDLLALTDTTSTYAGGSNASFTNEINGPATWLEFLDQDTNVVKSQVVDDEFDRYYSASPSQEPLYNTYDRITAGKPFWKLGVPAPGCAPMVSVTAGGNYSQYGNLSPASGQYSPSSVNVPGNSILLIPITPQSSGELVDINIPYNVSIPSGPYQALYPGVPSGTVIGVGAVPLYFFGSFPAGFNAGPVTYGGIQFFNTLITTPGTYANMAYIGGITGIPASSLVANTTGSLFNIIVNSDGSIGIQNLTVYFVGCVYADDNGSPGALLATGTPVGPDAATGPFTTTNSGGTNISTFANPVSVNADTQYWIGILNTNSFNIQPALGGTAGVYFPYTATLDPPANAPNVDSLLATPAAFPMYADFTSSTDLVEARSYVYTWVSAYNEEGPPSPPTLTNGWSNGTWTIGLFTPPPADMGVDRNFAIARLYRTVVATGGSTVYFWVADISLGSKDPDAQALYAENPLVAAQFTAGVISNGGSIVTGLQSSLATGINPPTEVYEDTAPDNLVALSNQLPSTNWFPPPENLEGLMVMPNGMMAGFKDNELWFCEPYLPHAWPPGYVLTTDFPIVGLGLSNNAAVACTGATAYVASGVSPGNMTLTKCSRAEPCIARASILGGDEFVTYMSPNGLIQVTPNGVCTNTTDLWVTREKWQQTTPQKYPRAIYLASCYYCFGSTSPSSVVPSDNSEAQAGFTIELDQDNASFSIWPQPGGHRLGFNGLTAPNAVNIDNVLLDPWTGTGMLIQGGALYYFDFSNPTPVMQPYEWKSKIYQQNTKKSYAAIKVFFQVPPGTPAPNQPRVEAEQDDPIWNTLGPTQYGIIKTYADPAVEGQSTGTMVLVDCREIRKSGELLRLPSDFKAENWQWEILGRVVVSNVQIATSAKELANV
jgi:hypothetical protein